MVQVAALTSWILRLGFEDFDGREEEVSTACSDVGISIFEERSADLLP